MLREMTWCGKEGKKVTSWWKQEVKDDIQAKKVDLRHGFTTKPTLHLRYAEALKSAALRVRKTKMQP